MGTKRARLNISIDRDTLTEARELSRRYGFRSVSSMAALMLRAIVTRASGAPEPTPGDEIRAIIRDIEGDSKGVRVNREAIFYTDPDEGRATSL